jgi:GWxTD domain-containing protein
MTAILKLRLNQCRLIIIYSCLTVLLIPILGVRYGWVTKKESPRSRKFLSLVRYIISKDEAKFYKNLPVSQREDFIELFWQARDPNIYTLENEFKTEYLRRIKEANKRFTAGRQGWLTDRGKTYILLGPPRYISFYPTGGRYYSKPYVVWHYREVFLIFIDERGDGDYKVHYLEKMKLHHHALAQEVFAKARRNLKVLSGLFNYSFRIKKINGIPKLIFKFPLNNRMNFQKKGNFMVTEFNISIIAKDTSNKTIWDYKKIHYIRLNPNKNIPKTVNIGIPLDEKIKIGKYFFFTSVQKMDETCRGYHNKMVKFK